MIDNQPQRKNKIVPITVGLICIVGVGLGVFAYLKKPLVNVPETAALPKFITADVVDLANYGGVSKFRSGAGHSFASSGEKCRSMKHYFLPKVTDTHGITDDPSKIPTTIETATNLPSYSPVNGKITKIQSEQHPLGKQIYIQPSGYDSYTIRLFHVYPLETITEGTVVTAGQRIGSLLPYQQTDVAVQATTIKGPQYISFFDVMTDGVFAAYQARGIATRNDVIISKETRDASPLTCQGEQFTPPSNNGADWTYFSDFTPPQQYKEESSNSTESSSTGQGSQSGTGGGSQTSSGGHNKNPQE